MSRSQRALARSAPDAASYPHPLIDRLDPELPWAVMQSTLAVIAQLMRHPAPLSAEARAAINAAMRDGRTAGGDGAVAILSLRGLITPRGSYLSYLFGGGYGGLEAFRDDFRDALDDSDISAILIDVDSPGGSADLVAETAAEIRAARGAKPIVAIANTLAASAAYWIACQADEVVATPSGQVGSIGCYTIHQDWTKFNDEFGVLPTYVYAGKFKVEGNPDEPLDDTAKSAWQRTVDDYYDLFVADVAAGRGVSEQTVRDGYGEGRVMPAGRALEAQMVDRVESFEQTVDRLVTGDSGLGGAPGALSLTGTRALLALQRDVLGLAAETPDDQVADAWRALLASAQGPTGPQGATAASPPASGDGDDSPADPPPAEEAAATATPPWLLFPTPRH